MIEKEILDSSNDCCCSEPTTTEQVNLIKKRDSVSQIFAECGKTLGNQARQVLQLAKKKNKELHLCKPTSNPKTNKLNTTPKYREGFWKSFNFDKLATGLLVLMILLILVLGLCLVRSYNRAHAYGTGGCLWPVFWGQCQIMT